jgi:hypothetical protein
VRRDRSPWIVALALAACQPIDFDEVEVEIDVATRSAHVWLEGRESPPCPILDDGTQVALNGVGARIIQAGGESRWVDEVGEHHYECNYAELGAGDLPLDTGSVILDIDSQVVMQVDWPPALEIWTDDDLAAAASSGDPFTVSWSPEDAALDRLAVEYGGPPVTLERIDSGAGFAQYQFVEQPFDPWQLLGDLRLTRTPASCEGFQRCSVTGTLADVVLGP